MTRENVNTTVARRLIAHARAAWLRIIYGGSLDGTSHNIGRMNGRVGKDHPTKGTEPMKSYDTDERKYIGAPVLATRLVEKHQTRRQRRGGIRVTNRAKGLYLERETHIRQSEHGSSTLAYKENRRLLDYDRGSLVGFTAGTGGSQ